MLHSLLILSTVGLCALLAGALPTSEKRAGTLTILSTAQVTSYKPYTYYAGAAHCNASKTLTWTCGSNCNANPSFKPVASGGDGDNIQFWYVGYDPTLATVIVGHQGTDTSKILPIITDIDFFQEKLDTTLFPGLSTSIEVHNGFKNAQAKAAPAVLAAVKSAISKYSAKKVTIVGHSLGGAIALLDAVYLPLHISGMTWKTVTYGMPRVGNQAFADYVDAHVTSLTHINNKGDPVPILPGRFLGFHHPSGEVHISDASQWVSCPGQDNTDELCEIGAVPNVFDATPGDHSGPYDGILLGC